MYNLSVFFSDWRSGSGYQGTCLMETYESDKLDTAEEYVLACIDNEDDWHYDFRNSDGYDDDYDSRGEDIEVSIVCEDENYESTVWLKDLLYKYHPEYIVEGNDSDYREKLAADPETKLCYLEELANDENQNVLEAVLNNPSSDADIRKIATEKLAEIA